MTHRCAAKWCTVLATDSEAAAANHAGTLFSSVVTLPSSYDSMLYVFCLYCGLQKFCRSSAPEEATGARG